MLNIDEIQNGIVIDHIKAGTAVGLMDLLGIAGNRTASVALIQNARSKKTASGRKDIIKVEGDASWLNLDVLAYLDPNISVTIIENGKAVRKEQPKPPKRLVNIVRCKNPRCISSIEEECDQIFELSSNGKYRCIYCEQELQRYLPLELSSKIWSHSSSMEEMQRGLRHFTMFTRRLGGIGFSLRTALPFSMMVTLMPGSR